MWAPFPGDTNIVPPPFQEHHPPTTLIIWCLNSIALVKLCHLKQFGVSPANGLEIQQPGPVTVYTWDFFNLLLTTHFLLSLRQSLKDAYFLQLICPKPIKHRYAVLNFNSTLVQWLFLKSQTTYCSKPALVCEGVNPLNTAPHHPPRSRLDEQSGGGCVGDYFRLCSVGLYDTWSIHPVFQI